MDPSSGPSECQLPHHVSQWSNDKPVKIQNDLIKS
jgi:hypothetical protein